MNSAKHYQSGAVLIVCLMFLMIMSVLGISSMNNATLEEKMAGNTRNKHLSFQAAETALRAGEIAANAFDVTTKFSGTNGRYQPSVVSDATYPIWENVDNSDWLEPSYTSGMSQQPKYIIENYSTMPRDSHCLLDSEAIATCKKPVYRITARGWGQNDNHITVLQSTFR
jgi:type IV pilus assembly protein PilX